MAVTPVAGLASIVVVGGTPVVAIGANPAGGFITNPADPIDQGVDPPENLYINPVGDATTEGNGTTFAIPPGGSWPVIPGQTTVTSVNAATAGHKFSVVSWP